MTAPTAYCWGVTVMAWIGDEFPWANEEHFLGQYSAEQLRQICAEAIARGEAAARERHTRRIRRIKRALSTAAAGGAVGLSWVLLRWGGIL